MGKYLKLFENHAQYEQYISGETAVLPNVSHCINEAELHFNPTIPPETDVVLTFNVTNVEDSYKIYDNGGQECFSKIEIDGTEVSISDLDSDSGCYSFSTTGNHTVKLTLIDPTTFAQSVFYNCDATTMYIPDSVIYLGYTAVHDCPNLTTIYFNENNTSQWGKCNFGYCPNLDAETVTKLTNCLPEEYRNLPWGDAFWCD